MARGETELVQLQVRLRENLRRNLEESAAARRVPLNTEIVERLAYTRDRAGLLPEILELAYGAPTAGVVMLLAMAMEDAGNLYMDSTRRRYYATDIHWTDEPAAYEVALRTALALLIALRPMRRQAGAPKKAALRNRESAARQFEELAHAVRSGPDRSQRTPPWADITIIRSLLGPLAKRMTEARLAEAKRTLRRAKGVTHPAVTADASELVHIDAEHEPPSAIDDRPKVPAALAVAVLKAAASLEDLRAKVDVTSKEGTKRTVEILERDLKTFLVPDWQQRGADYEAEAEEVAAEVKRRA